MKTLFDSVYGSVGHSVYGSVYNFIFLRIRVSADHYIFEVTGDHVSIPNSSVKDSVYNFIYEKFI